MNIFLQKVLALVAPMSESSGAGTLPRPESTTQENTMIKFINDEQGATAIEYGLIATLVGIAIIAAATALGAALSGAFTTAGNAITP